MVGKWRIEAKFTTKRKYSLRLDDLLKIESECSGLEKPVFVVEFKNANNLSQGFKFAVVPFTREKALCYTDRRSYILHLPELITALQEKEKGSPLLTLSFVTYGLGAPSLAFGSSHCKSFAVFYLDHWEEMVRGDADQDK